jgi:exosortase A-associated hydrolase 1
MNHSDETVLFDCAGDTLLGIVTRPDTPCDIGIVILVGGPQYRVGVHRHYVLLARALAQEGYPVLRFDYRGNGDSGGERRNYERVSDDIAAAIDALQRCVPGLRHVAMWGLCGAASAALIYCHEVRDARVIGLALMNPWIRTEGSLAHTHVKHYYTRRLVQREFWMKLASGKVGSGALSEFWRSLRLAWTSTGRPMAQGTFQQRMAAGWHDYPGRILLLLSGRDFTAKEFLEYAAAQPEWKGAFSRPGLQRCDLPDADHVCSERIERARMHRLILEWLSGLREVQASPGMAVVA